MSESVLAKQRICTNLPTPRDFSCTKYQNPSRSQTLNNFPETKHYFLLRNSFLLGLRFLTRALLQSPSNEISSVINNLKKQCVQGID